jgi:hypothetical protein
MHFRKAKNTREERKVCQISENLAAPEHLS